MGRFKREEIKPVIKHKKPDRYANYYCVRCDNYDNGYAMKGIKLCYTCAGDWTCNCEMDSTGSIQERIEKKHRMGIEVICNDCGALKPVTKLCPHCRLYEAGRIPEYFDCCNDYWCIDKAKEELRYYGKEESQLKIYDPWKDNTIVKIKGRYD
jgi:hypothetical protein